MWWVCDPRILSSNLTRLLIIPSGVDSACHPSEVGKMSTSLLGGLSHLSILRRSGDLSRIVPNSPGDCFDSTNALYRVCSQWLDGSRPRSENYFCFSKQFFMNERWGQKRYRAQYFKKLCTGYDKIWWMSSEGTENTPIQIC